MGGRVAGLQVRPAAGREPEPREAVEAVADAGLVGDHARGGARGITLLDAQAWRAAAAEAGDPDLPWGARRANVLVEGLPLAGLRGRRLRLGEVELDVQGETTPCARMDEARPGLQGALAVEGRGGVHGRVVVGGRIRLGDEVSLVEGEPVEGEGEER